MNDEDPYVTPQENPELQDTEIAVAPFVVVEHLRHTRKWVKFCSIMGFTTSVTLVSVCATLLFYMPNKLPYPYTYLLGAFYFILSILFFMPSVKLSQYEKAITKLTITRNMEDLEFAIAHQRLFWKQIAIMIFLIMAIYVSTITISTLVIAYSE